LLWTLRTGTYRGLPALRRSGTPRGPIFVVNEIHLHRGTPFVPVRMDDFHELPGCDVELLLYLLRVEVVVVHLVIDPKLNVRAVVPVDDPALHTGAHRALFDPLLQVGVKEGGHYLPPFCSGLAVVKRRCFRASVTRMFTIWLTDRWFSFARR
jgi:hypothetical protein